jgi:hypothetical protein
MDAYKAIQNVQDKMLLEVLEAQSLNSDICDSKTKTLQLWRKVEEDSVEGSVYVQQPKTEKHTGNVVSAQNGCARVTVQRNSNNMWQLQGIILVETNFFVIYVVNYIFLSSNILSISLHLIAWDLKNLNKSAILTSVEPINWILKKMLQQ